MSTVFDFAVNSDADGILEILEDDVAEGAIRILYTRRDNPLESYAAESEKSVVGVIRNNGRVSATIACIPRKIYLEGKQCMLSYVTGYKKRKDEKAIINWPEAFDRMYHATECDLYCCSVVAENEKVLKMLHKKRKGIPYAIPIDTYHTYILSPRAHVHGMNRKLTFRQAVSEDEEELIGFYQTYGSRKNLFPVIDSADFISGLDISDYYILSDGVEILAAGALFDRSNCKQYLVKEYAGYMKFFRAFNPIVSLLGYVDIPKENVPFSFAFLSFFLAKEDNDTYFRTFLNHILKIASAKFSMVILGTNGHNPKKKILDSVRHISFSTQLNEINLSEMSGKDIPEYDKENIEVECALL